MDTQMETATATVPLQQPVPSQELPQIPEALTPEQEAVQIVGSIQAPPHYSPSPPIGAEAKMVLNTYRQNYKDFLTAQKAGNQMLETMFLHQCNSNHITLAKMVGPEILTQLQIPINPRVVLEEKRKEKQKFQDKNQKPLSKNQIRKRKRHSQRKNMNKQNLSEFLQVAREIMRQKD
ncbi:hypothetical protein PPACK8108_LOCUS576 [Phakopsora pachyrhizi]|uniref:Uncharacterized protein n=1 Tax=Phakopsora pachyrhizi TaxID=170000 RepID=A0AAV0ADX9_PHAPC|nr:hypothetical protein PPACK8108_LOCUS576 [Phakopsora pachyrhizi]